MKCFNCQKELETTYEKEYVQITHTKTWSCPDGHSGSATLAAAVCCSMECAQVACIAFSIKEES